MTRERPMSVESVIGVFVLTFGIAGAGFLWEAPLPTPSADAPRYEAPAPDIFTVIKEARRSWDDLGRIFKE